MIFSDKERLDFLEKLAKESSTGVSVEWIPSIENHTSGYRLSSCRVIRRVHATIRASIDDAMREK